MDDRQQQLNVWLSKVLPESDITLTTASADASFRRYFRVHLAQPCEYGATLIAMDAPPPQENCEPFVRIAILFGEAAIIVK